VQRICAESEELKALEQRLKLAYLNKERSAQVVRKRTEKLPLSFLVSLACESTEFIMFFFQCFAVCASSLQHEEKKLIRKLQDDIEQVMESCHAVISEITAAYKFVMCT
jgi:hypothetical protein